MSLSSERTGIDREYYYRHHKITITNPSIANIHCFCQNSKDVAAIGIDQPDRVLFGASIASWYSPGLYYKKNYTIIMFIDFLIQRS